MRRTVRNAGARTRCRTWVQASARSSHGHGGTVPVTISYHYSSPSYTEIQFEGTPSHFKGNPPNLYKTVR